MDTKANGASYVKISDPGLLDKIDNLFAHNVGDLIELPQLVVGRGPVQRKELRFGWPDQDPLSPG
jgi:hypothetical protein